MLTIEHTNSISYITPFHITYMIWESIHTSHYSDIMMTFNHLTIIGNLSSIFKTNCPDFVVFYARCWSWCWASGLPSIQYCTVRDVINWIITEGSLWCHKGIRKDGCLWRHKVALRHSNFVCGRTGVAQCIIPLPQKFGRRPRTYKFHKEYKHDTSLQK